MKQPEDMTRDELADHMLSDHALPTNGRSYDLLLEDHEVDHQSIISQQRVIRHTHE